MVHTHTHISISIRRQPRKRDEGIARCSPNRRDLPGVYFLYVSLVARASSTFAVAAVILRRRHAGNKVSSSMPRNCPDRAHTRQTFAQCAFNFGECRARRLETGDERRGRRCCAAARRNRMRAAFTFPVADRQRRHAGFEGHAKCRRCTRRT